MTTTGKYILDAQGQPTPETDLFKWGAWLQTADRHVAKTRFCGQFISTVFLGLDHSFSDGAAPVLWETMIFDSVSSDGKMLRCAGSREQAEAMHAKIIHWLITGAHVGSAWFNLQAANAAAKCSGRKSGGLREMSILQSGHNRPDWTNGGAGI